MYNIDVGIELPSKANKKTYPFENMQVGDSFLFPMADRAKIASAAVVYAKSSGAKFATRKINELEGRCWRVL